MLSSKVLSGITACFAARRWFLLRTTCTSQPQPILIAEMCDVEFLLSFYRGGPARSRPRAEDGRAVERGAPAVYATAATSAEDGRAVESGAPVLCASTATSAEDGRAVERGAPVLCASTATSGEDGRAVERGAPVLCASTATSGEDGLAVERCSLPFKLSSPLSILTSLHRRLHLRSAPVRSRWARPNPPPAFLHANSVRRNSSALGPRRDIRRRRGLPLSFADHPER